MEIGERSTWENMSSIECNCTIEATLDSCVAKITNRVRAQHDMLRRFSHHVGSRDVPWTSSTALRIIIPGSLHAPLSQKDDIVC